MSDQLNGFHHADWRPQDPPPACADSFPLLEDLHDGLLSLDERARVEQHVAGCPYCAGLLGELAAVDQLVRAAPTPRVDGRLRDAVYARLADEAHDRTAPHLRESAQRDERPAPSEHGPTSPRALSSGRTPRRAARPWMGAVAAAAVVIGLALVMTLVPGHGLRPGILSTPTASVQRTPLPSALLPAFGDWRVAYLASDGSVHAVSLDGKTDLAGPALPGLTNDSVFAGMSSDGHHLAYIDAPKWGDLIVVDLRTSGTDSSRTVTYSGQITGASWSPDGTRLVADATLSSGHGLYVFAAGGGTPSLVPGTSDTGPLANSILQGWYDNARILAMVNIASVSGTQGAVAGSPVAARAGSIALAALAPHSSSPKVLATVDVTTGQAVELSAVPGQAVVGPTLVVMSPDHTLALAENSCDGMTGCTVQPEIYLVDLATGHLTPLPHITAATNGNPQYATWLPGTHTVLALGGAATPATSPLLLLDLDHDTVTRLAKGIFPITLSPDGQTLIAGDSAANDSLVSEYPLYAFTPVSASGHRITLTEHMVRSLGLAKTA